MGFSVNLQGIKEVQEALKNIDVSVKKDVSNEINASALKIQNDAKRLAPVNFGQLRNGIQLEKVSDLTFSVESKASYSPYVEFGTGGRVSVPADFQAYAQTFKGGKGGKFKDFVAALTLWVKRKGIGNGKNDKGLAYVIALNILRKGLRPQPFLIPAYEKEKPQLIKRIKDLLNA
jgi:HK97 gp10 family phage protein